MTLSHILSVQSHVAFGHVGNAAAVFPLQRMGYEVWPLHTCMLSNHTGYPPLDGTVMCGEIFQPSVVDDIVRMLANRQFLGHLSGVLSGWLGKAEIGQAVLDSLSWAERQKRPEAPSPLYLCDPVLGDDDAGTGDGRLYAAPDIPAFFRDRLLPVADVITPNRFEVELLSGKPVTDQASAITAARSLIGRDANRIGGQGPWMCVVTSLPDSSDPTNIGCVAVTRDAAWRVQTPRLTFTNFLNGSGDVLAALLLGNLLRMSEPADALAHAVSGLYAVLQHTQVAQPSLSGRPELALIAAQDDMIRPPRLFEATPV